MGVLTQPCYVTVEPVLDIMHFVDGGQMGVLPQPCYVTVQQVWDIMHFVDGHNALCRRRTDGSADPALLCNGGTSLGHNAFCRRKTDGSADPALLCNGGTSLGHNAFCRRRTDGGADLALPCNCATGLGHNAFCRRRKDGSGEIAQLNNCAAVFGQTAICGWRTDGCTSRGQFVILCIRLECLSRHIILIVLKRRTGIGCGMATGYLWVALTARETVIGQSLLCPPSGCLFQEPAEQLYRVIC